MKFKFLRFVVGVGKFFKNLQETAIHSSVITKFAVSSSNGSWDLSVHTDNKAYIAWKSA